MSKQSETKTINKIYINNAPCILNGAASLRNCRTPAQDMGRHTVCQGQWSHFITLLTGSLKEAQQRENRSRQRAEGCKQFKKSHEPYGDP